MGLKIITEPTSEPITLEEARLHLGIVAYDSDGHPHDAMIEGMISSARTYAEEFTGLSLAIKTYELALDQFPEFDEIQLDMAPVIDITSVSYIDEDLVQQSILDADFVLDSYQKPAWLLPAIDFDWPATGSVINAVKIRYRAGYVPTPDSDEPLALLLPSAIKGAMLLLLADLYENRGQTIPGSVSELPVGVQGLLRPYRVRLGMA